MPDMIVDPVDASAEDKALAERREIVGGLRDLANLLEANPGLPVWFVSVHARMLGARAPRDEQIAEIEQFAQALNVAPSLEAESIQCRRDFGSHVQYAMAWRRDDVCTPRIEDGKVVWDLPDSLLARAETSE